MRSLTIALALSLSPLSLAAQGLPAAEPGDSVRVSAGSLGSSAHRGTLVSVMNDSLTFKDAEAGGLPTSLPMVAVSKFEVNRGNLPPKSSFWRGAMVGTLVGAAGTALIFGATYTTPACPPNDWFCLYPSRGEMMVGGAILGAVGGFLLGGLIGGTVVRHSSYKAVNLSTVGMVASALSGRGDVAVRPTWDFAQHAPGVAVAVRF